MTAAAPRTEHGTPDLRRVGVAVGALTLAVALLVAVAFIRQDGGPSAATSGQVPAHQALPSLHGSPAGTTAGDMSSAARAALYPAAAAVPGDIGAALYAAQQQAAAEKVAAAYAATHPAPAVLPRDVASAIYEAQQLPPSEVSSALSAALNSAPAVLPATRGDMSASAYATLNAAALPVDINAAIYAAQQQAAEEMSSAAYAALHPASTAASATNQETTSAAIAARDAARATPSDMTSAAYAALYPAGATTATHADMSSASYLNHRAR